MADLTKAETKAPELVQWEFRNVRGPKDLVLQKIAESNAPADVKTFLSARVTAKEYEGVILHAHGHDHEGREVCSHDIAKLY